MDSAEPAVELWVDDHQKYEPGVVTGHPRHARIPLDPHCGDYLVVGDAMDRRGFGASGEGPGYAIERDFEDVASVVDAVAARTGGPVALFGHSYGANCAMGAATLTSNVHHLVLYEPSMGLSYPPGSIEAVERAAAGDLDRVVVTMFVDILKMTEEEIDAIRASTTPSWALVEPVELLEQGSASGRVLP